MTGGGTELGQEASCAERKSKVLLVTDGLSKRLPADFNPNLSFTADLGTWQQDSVSTLVFRLGSVQDFLRYDS